MRQPTAERDASQCRAGEVGAYLDGELDAASALAFDAHLKECRDCAVQLLEQKRLLCLFDTAFGEALKPQFELPRDFARVVTARAQTDMSGLLRRPAEHGRAFLLTTLLAIASCALLGAALFDKIFAPATRALGVLLRLLLMAAHTLLDAAAGALVILRTLGGRLVAEPLHLRLMLWLLLTVALVWLLRLIGRQPEAEKE